MEYIDISDSAPTKPPADFPTRYSISNDASGFMKIEAAGGCGSVLKPGESLSLTVEVISKLIDRMI